LNHAGLLLRPEQEGADRIAHVAGGAGRQDGDAGGEVGRAFAVDGQRVIAGEVDRGNVRAFR